MAFRASRKSTSSTKKPQDAESVVKSVPLPDAPADATFSVDDLVGGPVSVSQEPVKESSPLPSPVNVQASPVPDPVRDPVRSTNFGTEGFRREGGQAPHREYRPQAGSSFHRNRMGEKRYLDTGSYDNKRSGYDSHTAVRRYPEAGNGFSQDVNVPTQTVGGMLDIMPEGHGFLRPKFTPSDRDVYISQSQIRRFLLRNGDVVGGQARAPKDNERYWGLLKVETINDQPAETMERRPNFEDLVPVYPNRHLKLETGPLPLSTRIIDLIAPIGFGQRGLIVSPPKAGKTTILKELAAGISANYPNVHLMAALIGERPEEVTDITRSVKGEVLASNFDESPSEQTRIAEVALERAKRLVEMGRDVVILLDSITRLARAYNLVVNPSGRTLSGGFDPAALYPAKRFLGAARCVEKQMTDESLQAKEEEKKEEKEEKPVVSVTGGGSLTVIGTALVETGSRMDDLIYEEFKGTGNMELHLTRLLQERRVFPAIDVEKSGTRHDELLLGEEKMKKIATLRHMLSVPQFSPEERTLLIIERMNKTKTNDEFLESLSKG